MRVLDNKGMGMIGSIMSVGIAGAVMAGVMSLVSVTNKSQARHELSVDSIAIKSDLSQLFISPSNCKNAFIDLPIDTSKVSAGPLTSAVAQNIPLSAFDTKKIGTVLLKDYKIGKLAISSLTLQLTDNSSAPLYAARVYINVGLSNGNPVVPPLSSKILNVYFKLNDTSGKIEGCTTDADEIGNMLAGKVEVVEGDGQRVYGSGFDWPDAIVCERPGARTNVRVYNFQRTHTKNGTFVIRYMVGCTKDCHMLFYYPDGRFHSRANGDPGPYCDGKNMVDLIASGAARFY